jgi:hypothetical protein
MPSLFGKKAGMANTEMKHVLDGYKIVRIPRYLF